MAFGSFASSRSAGDIGDADGVGVVDGTQTFGGDNAESADAVRQAGYELGRGKGLSDAMLKVK